MRTITLSKGNANKAAQEAVAAYYNPYDIFRPFRLGERANAWPIEWYMDPYIEDGQGRKPQ